MGHDSDYGQLMQDRVGPEQCSSHVCLPKHTHYVSALEVIVQLDEDANDDTRMRASSGGLNFHRRTSNPLVFKGSITVPGRD